MASPVVLDSSAILAVVFSEPGSDAILPLLQGGLLSSVNLAEVHTRLLLRGASPDFAWRRILDLGCVICYFDDLQARHAAELIGQTRSFGLSLGDRACLALALHHKATAYTTDAAWKNLDLEIDVRVIR